jgi:hypothetical protein
MFWCYGTFIKLFGFSHNNQKILKAKMSKNIYSLFVDPPLINIVKDQNGDLSDSHNVLNRWKNYLC